MTLFTCNNIEHYLINKCLLTKYVCLFLFLFLFSCDDPKSIISQFDVHSKLYAAKVLTIEDVYIKLPRVYNLTDSTLIITAPAMGFSSKNHLIYIVSKKTGKVIKSLGTEGRGPEEMMAVNTVSTLNNEILFYDAVSRKILHYNSTNDSICFQPIKSQKNHLLRNMYLLNDNKFLSYGFFGNKYMYNYGEITTGNESYYMEYPYLPGISDEKQKDFTMARSIAYGGQMLKHPINSRFVYFTRSAEYLQIIELNQTTVKEILHYNFLPPTGEVVFRVDAYVWGVSRMSPACFMGGSASKNYFYLLYSGKLFKDEDNEKSKFILVFDWNGNKIKMIELDKEVYSITVDGDDKEIFAYTTNNETLKNEIVNYKL